MRIPSEVQCKTCSQVFCCAKCRQKHEDNKHHDLKAIRQICYICNKRPFPLHIDTKASPNNLLLAHIINEHLPLRCNSCSKVFHTASDFKSIARCHVSYSTNTDNACRLEGSSDVPIILETAPNCTNTITSFLENKENIEEICNSGSTDRLSVQSTNEPPLTAIKVKIGSSTAMDNAEELAAINEVALTPLSMINLRWKRKSLQSFDSLLSTTTNISAVNASEGAVQISASPKKKLVRTTSTPMMHGCLPLLKGANESYSSAMGQMSSIHCNSGSDTDSKTEDATQGTGNSYEINKVRAIIRSRSKVAATPLRQVMSKSIQRAMVQHGYYAKMVAPGTQRKMSFGSTASNSLNSTLGSPSQEILDLRTTPVLKRSSSETSSGFNKTAKVVRLSQVHSEDCIASQSSLAQSEYFDAHQNCESLNKSGDVDQENRDNQKLVDESDNLVKIINLGTIPGIYQDTPKVTGGMLKKVISFNTPEVTQYTEHHNENTDLDESNEIYATPCAIPRRSYSCSALMKTHFDSDEKSDAASSSDDVFLPPPCPDLSKKLYDNPPPRTAGKLWTIVSNVIRLARRVEVPDQVKSTQFTDSCKEGHSGETNYSSGLVRKAVTFADFFKNHFPVRQPRVTQQHSSSGSDDSFSSKCKVAGAKRRRGNAVYTRPYETLASASTIRISSSPLAKRKRIQGRQPIERLRRHSSRSQSGSDY